MKLKTICMSVIALTISTAIYAGEETTGAGHGKKVHAEHCNKCHTDSVYTRIDRFVNSIDALGKQVVRCKDGNNIPWFDEDTDAVVQFLNNKYYKF